MEIRTVTATRYVTPLREGGSLPAIVEADDDGLYVLKFRGAGQGPKALIAELVSGEVARAIGLPVPEIVFVYLDGDMARTEPDPEIQDLIRASDGLNLAMDYLPGSITFDPIADRFDDSLASGIVWFDSYTKNVDRTPRNPNMLVWHKKLWLIDHGASLYFHHGSNEFVGRARSPFPQIKEHIMLSQATSLNEVDRVFRERLSGDLIEQIVQEIPGTWLEDNKGVRGDQLREEYIGYLRVRLEVSGTWIEEALNARSMHV